VRQPWLAALVLSSLASPGSAQSASAGSSAWLNLLPDGEAKRKFVLDCTGCHQFDSRIALTAWRPRTEQEWVDAVTRMLSYAGANTGFPVIAADRDAKKTAAWLTRHLRDRKPLDRKPAPSNKVEITEFPMPDPKDLPHDVVVTESGSVLITGMFTHRLYSLDPAAGRFSEIAIPVVNANPRAIDLDSLGWPWVVLGEPKRLAVLEGNSQWRSFDVGMYPHSLAIGNAGKIWFNGHFTHNPELIGSVDRTTGKVVTHEVPAHPTLGRGPGGPIPYEIRAGPDGRIWGSELLGNRIFAFTPGTGKFEMFSLPAPHSGPRRFDVDTKGIVWIPAYAANSLLRFEPATRQFTEIPLPIRDAVPYVVRAHPSTGALWIGTSAADALLRYDPATERFEVYHLPSRGALIRHLALSPRGEEVWAAYGAVPGIAARVARFRRR